MESHVPHPLRGNQESVNQTAPFTSSGRLAPTPIPALTELAEKAVDALNLGKAAGTDFLAVSYSSVDYVGHEFGPAAAKSRTFL